MLIDIAIGDAYGALFEFSDKDVRDKYNNLTYPKENYVHPIVKSGCYTDDTQMSIAIVEALLEDKFTREGLADKFVECFKRDPRRGYAGRFFLFLQDVKDGKEFLEKIRGGSNKSGGAMRAMPLGVYDDLDELVELCDLQCRLTHNTPEGMLAARISAMMAHYFFYNVGPKEDLFDWLHNSKAVTSINDKLNINVAPWEWDKVPTVVGMDCVRAAGTILSTSRTQSQILTKSVQLGGDTDTVCAIAMGAACFGNQFKKDIPQGLYDGLENGKYGREYLYELDAKFGNWQSF